MNGLQPQHTVAKNPEHKSATISSLQCQQVRCCHSPFTNPNLYHVPQPPLNGLQSHPTIVQ